MPTANMWITQDHLNDYDVPGDEGAGRAWFHQIYGDPTAVTPSPALQAPFRLYDDDGVLYYSGFSDTSFDELDQFQAFAPLDWSVENCGCAYMMVLVNGQWEQL